jgi:2,5-diketo-D-gluconate reductase A
VTAGAAGTGDAVDAVGLARVGSRTMSTVPDVTLNNGVQVPILGFGVYQIPPDDTERCVGEALEVGYRHIDTAAAYRNEEGVGRAIAASGLPRDEVVVTTKLWIHQPGEDLARRALEQSLERLGLDRIDLYLIHQPISEVNSFWRDKDRGYEEGLVRAIGVSNFYPDRLVDLIENNAVVPAVNQIEAHPFFQRHDDHEVLRERGVQLESWGPFAEGKRDLFTNPVLSAVGAAHGKSVAQVVLRWFVQRDIVVIPKSVRRERMAENFDIFDFELTDDDLAKIADLDTGESIFFDHRTAGAAKMFNDLKVR